MNSFPLGRLLYRASLCIVTTVGTRDALAQSPPPPPDLGPPRLEAAVGEGGLQDFFSARTPYEFWLTCIIILFGLAVIGLLLLHSRTGTNSRSEDVHRAVIVVTVITGALVLVTAGYSNAQIAPAFGLLGTVVGYVLSKFERNPQRSGSPTSTPSEQREEKQ